MDIIPFFRYAGAIILFGLSFYFLNISYTTFRSFLSGDSYFFPALHLLWTVLPGVVLLFAGIRLVMVMHKQGV